MEAIRIYYQFAENHVPQIYIPVPIFAFAVFPGLIAIQAGL
jgi:hypothetical protein